MIERPLSFNESIKSLVERKNANRSWTWTLEQMYLFFLETSCQDDHGRFGWVTTGKNEATKKKHSIRAHDLKGKASLSQLVKLYTFHVVTRSDNRNITNRANERSWYRWYVFSADRLDTNKDFFSKEDPFDYTLRVDTELLVSRRSRGEIVWQLWSWYTDLELHAE